MVLDAHAYIQHEPMYRRIAAKIVVPDTAWMVVIGPAWIEDWIAQRQDHVRTIETGGLAHGQGKLEVPPRMRNRPVIAGNRIQQNQPVHRPMQAAHKFYRAAPAKTVPDQHHRAPVFIYDLFDIVIIVASARDHHILGMAQTNGFRQLAQPVALAIRCASVAISDNYERRLPAPRRSAAGPRGLGSYRGYDP